MKDSYIAPFVFIGDLKASDLSLLSRCNTCVKYSSCSLNLFLFIPKPSCSSIPWWIYIHRCLHYDNQLSLF